MKKHSAFIIASAMALGACSHGGKKFNYPMTSKVDTVDNYFGTKVPDPYRWLEDDRSEATAQWVKEQNAVTRAYLDSISCRKAISDRLSALWNFPRQSAPYRKGDKYFFAKNDGLQNQSVYYMSDTPDGSAVEVLNPNTLSDNGTVALTNFSVSDDGKYLGYGIARNGSDWNEFFVRDLTTLADLPDHLEWIKFSTLQWHGNGFFYSRFPQPTEGDELKGENIDNAVYYHRLGDAQPDDRLVFSDDVNRHRSYSTQVTDDGKLLVIYVTESTSGNGIFVLDLTDEHAQVVRLIDNFENDYTVLGHENGRLYVHTNYNAPRYQIVAIDMTNPQPVAWETIVPQAEADVMESASLAGGRFFVTYMHDARSVVSIYDMNGNAQADVELPGIGTVSDFEPYKSDDELYYTFSSYTSPSAIYKYSISQNKSELYKSPELDFDFADYVTEQVFYTSADGTRVPMFVVHRRDVKLDGTAPAWLYGYGGFNISLTPAFDLKRLLWLEQGGVYAVANLRGGGEYGEEWHQAGTKLNKQNVFDDFISAAKYLISQGYTSPDRLVCQGGSNGGLLIGATINQAPELFRVALPAVGVMDMLRYHKFTIGRYWATDYGTSEESAQMFRYLYGYSPLHNVADRKYPSVLVTTGDHDDRVVPAHSFKYIATMQEKYSGQRPLLIRIESQAGHGAGKPTSKFIEEWTDIYSFVFNEIGKAYVPVEKTDE